MFKNHSSDLEALALATRLIVAWSACVLRSSDKKQVSAASPYRLSQVSLNVLLNLVSKRSEIEDSIQYLAHLQLNNKALLRSDTVREILDKAWELSIEEVPESCSDIKDWFSTIACVMNEKLERMAS